MAKEKKILHRIQVVRATHKVTQSMKMISIAKLEGKGRGLAMLEGYGVPLCRLLERMMGGDLPLAHYEPLFVSRPVRRMLCIVITSDRGFCGAFNQVILHGVEEDYGARLQSGTLTRYMCIGKKGMEFFRKRGLPYVVAPIDLGEDIDWGSIFSLSVSLTRAFLRREYDQILVRYQLHCNASEGCEDLFLPMCVLKKSRDDAGGEGCIYEPNRASIVRRLIPEVLAFRLFKYIVLTQVAEYKSRMLAMTQATDNAEDLLRKLRLSYNRLRQAAVTRGIIEITAGF